MRSLWLRIGREAAKSLPPFSWHLAAGRRALVIALAVVIMLPVIGHAAVSASGYRLAGVVAVGKDYLGFLEVPQGGQVLIRLGSVVNGGRVVAFNEQVVRIQFPDGVVELPLAGSGKPPPPDTRGVVTAQEDSENGKVYIRQVDPDAVNAALRAPDGGKPSAAVAGNKAPVADTSAVLAQRFEPVFQLPRGSQITAINEKPVTSVDAAIKAVETSLKNNTPARLNIQTPNGEARVYLMTQPPPKL